MSSMVEIGLPLINLSNSLTVALRTLASAFAEARFISILSWVLPCSATVEGYVITYVNALITENVI